MLSHYSNGLAAHFLVDLNKVGTSLLYLLPTVPRYETFTTVAGGFESFNVTRSAVYFAVHIDFQAYVLLCDESINSYSSF